MNIGWRRLIRKRNRSLHIYPPFYLPIRSYVEDVFESSSSALAEYRRIGNENRRVQSRKDSAQLEDLASSIKNGHYRMAQAIRDELFRNGKVIEWDDCYLDAAHYSIRDSAANNGSQSSFSLWMKLLPYPSRHFDDRERFSKILGTLKEQPQNVVSLVHQFALALALKGYVSYVEDNLMSILRRYGTEDMVRDIKFHLLPVALPEPVSTNVFELEGDQYASEALESEAKEDSSVVLSRLHHCIESGWLEEAKTILSELVSVNHPIPPHSLYIKAARMALAEHRNNPSNADTLSDTFFLFLSHAPPAHRQSSESSPFRGLIEDVIGYHRHLLTPLALHLSSQGYAPLLSPLLLPTLLRITSPDDARTFLARYERADEEYTKSVVPTSWRKAMTPDSRVKINLTIIRDASIRALADIGHLDLAVSLVPERDTNLRLNHRTYELLLKKLQARLNMVTQPKKRAKLNVYLQRVQWMYEEALEQRTTASTLDGQSLSSAHVHDITTTTELANAVRSIKAALPFNIPRHSSSYKTASRLDVPTVVKLLKLFSSPEAIVANQRGVQESPYYTRPNLIRLLRRRALLSTGRPTKMWLFGEMVHLWHKKRYAEVLKLFHTHFWCFGVPESDILSATSSLEAPWPESWMTDLLEGIPSKKIAPKVKFHPVPYQHASLVWQSLAKVHMHDKFKLVVIYRKMIRYARAYQEASRSLTQSSEEEDGLDAPYISSPEFDSQSELPSFPLVSSENPIICVENFTPFIFELAPGRNRRSLMERDIHPTRILQDIVDLDMRPTIYHFTVLAIKYVSARSTVKALKVLDHLERANFRELNEDGETAASKDVDTLPAPDLICYTGLLRAFLSEGDMQGFAEVDRRMRARYGSLEMLGAEIERRKGTERVKENYKVIQKLYEDWEAFKLWESKGFTDH